MRGNERKHQHNRSVKSNLRGLEKNYRALLTAGKKTKPRNSCPKSIQPSTKPSNPACCPDPPSTGKSRASLWR